MKKILIVEDNKDYLDIAKDFFSTIITGYDFFFATNRKEAENFLPLVDAVITDASIPFDEFSEYNEILAEANGYLVVVGAKLMNKLAIITIQSAGQTSLGIVNNSSQNFHKLSVLAEFHLGKEINEKEGNQIHQLKFGSGIFSFNQCCDFTKFSQECWLFIWGELQKQF